MIKTTKALIFSCSLHATTSAQCYSALLASSLALCAPSEPPLTTTAPPKAPLHLPHPLVFPTMPCERGKPRWGTRNKNSITQDNQLTASQRALLAHFSRPHRHTRSTQTTLCTPKMETLPPLLQTQTQTSLCIPKTETSSPTVQSPSLPQHFSASTSKEEAPQCLNKVKEEAPPPV